MTPAHSGAVDPGPERPRPRFLVPGGQEGAAPEEVQRRAGQPRHDALGHPEVGEQLGAILALGGDDLRVAFELDAHRERVVAERLDETVGVVELVDVDVHDDQRRLVGQQEHRLEVGSVLRGRDRTGRRAIPSPSTASARSSVAISAARDLSPFAARRCL